MGTVKKKHPQGVEQFADSTNTQADATSQEQYITEAPKFKAICSDCLQYMRSVQDGSFDVIFTSPPYNDSARTERDMETKRHFKYKDIEFRDDWFEWQCECIDEMLRVTKRQVMYNVQPILSNKADVYRLIGRYADKIDQILIWYKPNAQPQHYPHRIANFYEMVIIFRCKDFGKLYVNSNGYSNVIVRNINSNREYCDIHRAVMSKDFCDEIVREFTQPNDVVFDPFMGMGTTGVSCLEIGEGRTFVGTEIDEEYYLKATERLYNVASQITFEDLGVNMHEID